jgi:hypothetical protein
MRIIQVRLKTLVLFMYLLCHACWTLCPKFIIVSQIQSYQISYSIKSDFRKNEVLRYKVKNFWPTCSYKTSNKSHAEEMTLSLLSLIKKGKWNRKKRSKGQKRKLGHQIKACRFSLYRLESQLLGSSTADSNIARYIRNTAIRKIHTILRSCLQGPDLSRHHARRS